MRGGDSSRIVGARMKAGPGDRWAGNTVKIRDEWNRPIAVSEEDGEWQRTS